MDKRKIIKKIKLVGLFGSGKQAYKYIMECQTCSKHFTLMGGRFNSGMGNFCSVKCRNQSYIGKKRPTYIGRKISKGLTGKSPSQETRDKMSFAKQGDKCWNWKGGIIDVHTWVSNIKGKASTHKCVDCKKQAKHWSNKDHSYKRILKDYKARCVKCHRRYDIKYNNYNELRRKTRNK